MVLLYLGVSLPNQIKNPLSHILSDYSSSDLTSCKLSHDEYPLLLDSLKSFDFVKEVTLITTCNRFELILFLEQGFDSDFYINKLRAAIALTTKSKLELDCLKNEEARLQFFRTYCGLNSGLVTEDEICMQIEISFKQCFHMNYLGKQGIQLLENAQKLRSIINKDIYQQRISYCQVAIEQALKSFDMQDLDHIVIAGSGSTAHQSCLSLTNLKFDPNKFTLAHRISSSSGQIATIKASPELEGMSYLRCKDGYHSQRMKDLVHTASLLVLGIDSRLPCLHFSKHNKTPVIDFSSKPSISFDENANLKNYISSSQLDKYVRDYSCTKLQENGFMSKIKLAEELIAKSLTCRDRELTRL